VAFDLAGARVAREAGLDVDFSGSRSGTTAMFSSTLSGICSRSALWLSVV